MGDNGREKRENWGKGRVKKLKEKISSLMEGKKGKKGKRKKTLGEEKISNLMEGKKGKIERKEKGKKLK